MMLSLFAAVSGQVLIQAVIWLIVVGIIIGLLWWLINYCAPPEPFRKVANVVVAIIAVLLIINVLLSLVGKAFIVW